MTVALKLYEIGEARDILESWLAESEGEVTPELEALLNEVDATFNAKVERVALWIREQEAHASAVHAEEERLRTRRVSLERATASLREYLLLQLERQEKPKVAGELVSVAVQRNSAPSVRLLVPPEELDPRFVTIVPAQKKANTKAIVDSWKAGDVPVGVELSLGYHLRIR